MQEPESLLRVPKYRAWKRALEEAGCRLRRVEAYAELPKHDGSLLFALLKVDGVDPEGNPLPRYALLRGAAVVVVTVVVNRATGERKFLMLRQRRIGNGRADPEFPAGMLDQDVDDAPGVAVREVREETGLEITPADLAPLADRPLYTSSGLDDEAIHYFACTVELPPERFEALRDGRGGHAEEGEFIRLGLWEADDALREATSLQVQLGFRLYFARAGQPAA